MRRSWEEIRKFGGAAPGVEKIRESLSKDNSKLLSRDQLIDIIASYFDGCMQKTADENGNAVYIWRKAPTKTGLAAAIGVTRQILCDYCNGTDSRGIPYGDVAHAGRRVATSDFDIIRRAMSIIEGFYEGLLAENRNNSGPIFWLTNSQERTWTNEHRNIVEYKKNITAISAAELPNLSKQQNDIFVTARDVTAKKVALPLNQEQEDD